MKTVDAMGDVPGGLVTKHTELHVYRLAFTTAMELFQLTKEFPKEETYSLTDQLRRSSRSVCANIAEGWRRRRYRAAFISKLNEVEGEAAETQNWIAFAVTCEYVGRETGKRLHEAYDAILRMLVSMIANADRWILK
jgi:four helix bundle protein